MMANDEAMTGMGRLGDGERRFACDVLIVFYRVSERERLGGHLDVRGGPGASRLASKSAAVGLGPSGFFSLGLRAGFFFFGAGFFAAATAFAVALPRLGAEHGVSYRSCRSFSVAAASNP